jgi:hypothetical protein
MNGESTALREQDMIGAVMRLEEPADIVWIEWHLPDRRDAQCACLDHRAEEHVFGVALAARDKGGHPIIVATQYPLRHDLYPPAMPGEPLIRQARADDAFGWHEDFQHLPGTILQGDLPLRRPSPRRIGE